MRLLGFLLALLATTLRTRASLQAEIVALRHQLGVYRRSGRRPRLTPADRLLRSVISRLWSEWRMALYFVRPRTVIDWQKKRFRYHWRRLSQSGPVGRPRISAELRNLIQRMWNANPTWGSPRIVGELGKLGIDVAKSTVERYRPRRVGPPSATWKAFLDQHVKDLAFIDFFVVPTVKFKLLFVFIAYYHDWRLRRSLEMDAPDHRAAQATKPGQVVEFPAVRGLHHYYLPQAA